MYLLSFVLVLMTVFASLSFSLVEQVKKVYPFTQEALKRKQHSLTFYQFLQAEASYHEHRCIRGPTAVKEENDGNVRSLARAFIPLHLLAGEQEDCGHVKKILLSWMDGQFVSEEFVPKEKKEQVFEQFIEEFQKHLQDLHKKEALQQESIGQLIFTQEEYQKLFYYLWEGVETENGLILPLKEFTTLQGSGAIRLWLAPKAVLSTLFDFETVEQIASLRKDLYKKLKQGTIDQDACSKLFSELITVDSSLLDFSCSSSNPEMYETKSL